MDVLVNDAGAISFRAIEDIAVEARDDQMAVNLRSAILKVSSNASVRRGNDETACCASKIAPCNVCELAGAPT